MRSTPLPPERERLEQRLEASGIGRTCLTGTVPENDADCREQPA
jgi:hypothetical protein